ncbi:unnamed protein product [Ectocarpus sp. CCAP 1310/34]|nr:unnamed protein product [Ectocarpus sp. CCAP 1310/34]
MANRYVLVRSDGDGPKPCAFYASAAGCRNAASCKFLHGDQPTAGSLVAKSQPPSATKAKPAAEAVTTPMPTPAASVTPLSANGHSAAAEEAARAAKKKAKKKTKKEREAREAAAAAAPATTPAPAPAPVVNGHSAAAEEPKGTANKKAKKKAKKEREAREAAAAGAATTPAPAQAPAPAPAPVASPAALTPTPAGTPAPVAVATGQILSKTKAKKQAFREKAARKAEAAAALATANANAANAAAAAAGAAALAAAARAANPSPPLAPPPTGVAPAVVPGAAAPTPVAAAAAPALPVSKKKKRKNKKKTAPAATPPAAGAVVGPPPPVFRQMPKMSTPPPPPPPPPSPATASKPTTRVCSFFNKKKGCQVGALCPYLHQGVERGGFGGTRGHAKPPTATVPPAAVGPPPASPVAVAAAAAASRKRKPASSPVAPAVDVAVVAAPVAAVMPVLPFAPPPPPTAVQAVPPPAEVAGGAASESPSSRRKRKRGRSETPAATAAAAGAGIFDGLPISPFVATAAAADKEEEPAAVAAVIAPASVPHPKADVWQMLVERTRAHPKFAKNYRFETDATWVTASPCGDSCPGLPQVIALDCEMCMSEDPLSKERNGKELLRLSIVRGEDGEKLMDTLVRPGNPVVDWRTDIHGVAPEHLEGVMFTHRHAQVAISRICCSHTVIIGHALNNDLTALKMKHDRVVDTSFLFEGSDEKFSTPSLKDVVKVALGRHIQDGSHDSVTDAKSTLEVARYALEKVGAPLPSIDRTKKASRRRNGEGSPDDAGGGKKRRGLENGEDDADARAAKAERERRSLMVHRLPAGTTPEQLMRVMQKKTKVIAQEAEGIEFTGTTGKTHVVYATKELADVAFNGISTAAKEDTSGRLQKRIYTSEDGKKYITVRHALVMNDDEEEVATGLDGLISSSSSSEED